MSLEVQLADFTATGVLGSAWTATGGTFTQDGQRAYATTPATYSRAVLVAVPAITASTPVKVRYEVDLLLPASFPSTGVVRGGLVFQGGYAHLTWTRTSGGASTLFDFYARNAAGTETSYYSTSVALTAGATYRLRADVTLYPFAMVVECFYSADAGATFTALFLSSPSLAVWNAATGQSLTTLLTASRTAGIVADVAGLPAYLDNLRVTDIGNLATNPTIDVAPATTAFPTLTPYTVSEEDDAGAETLTVQPSYALAVADEWAVTEHPYDGGYVGTVATQSVRRRGWEFFFAALSATDATAIGALRTAVHGTRSTFSWTEPATGESIRIKFVSDIMISLVAPGVYQAEATVREVLT